MKTLAFAAVLLCAAAAGAAPTAAAAPKPLLSCTTPGDALGGLQFTLVSGALTLVETGMDGKTSRTKLEQTPLDTNGAAAAIPAGKAFSAFFRIKRGTEFGGAISDAGIITIGAKTNGKRAGYMARTGTIYILTCNG
jgi:hypothetical protein